MLRKILCGVCIAAAAGCGSPAVSSAPPVPVASAAVRSAIPPPAIKNIIVIVQEHRSFNDLFAGFPGARTTTTGVLNTGQIVPLTPEPLSFGPGLSDSFESFATALDGGKMDGFGLADPANPAAPYSYVETSQSAPYWALAKAFTLADEAYETAGADSYVANLDLVRGSTYLDPVQAVISEGPSGATGCDAPSGTTTGVLDASQVVFNGPFPCFKWVSMATLLDDAHVSWKAYVPGRRSGVAVSDPFESLAYVANGPDRRKVIAPAPRVLSDLRSGNLAAVSWVFSEPADSDTPVQGADGPVWVASVVRVAQTSRYWKHTAILVVWDDWGGFYDEAPPPQLDALGLGIRIPLLVISPLAKKHYVDHTQYEFGSILKLIEQAYDLPPLSSLGNGYGFTDTRANSMVNAFKP